MTLTDDRLRTAPLSTFTVDGHRRAWLQRVEDTLHAVLDRSFRALCGEPIDATLVGPRFPEPRFRRADAELSIVICEECLRRARELGFTTA